MKHLHLIIGLCAFSISAIAEPTLEKAAEEIVQAGSFLNQAGLCPATSGNISMRVGENLVAMTVSGKHKGELTTDDIIMVDLQGKAQNTTKKPSAETLLHTAIYGLFTDCGAVLHTHTLDGTVLSRLVAPQTVLVTDGYEMHKAFPRVTTHESQLNIPIFENSQDMVALASDVTQFLKANPDVFGFLVRGHGLYTWGRDMKEAKIRVEAYEYLFECEMKMRSLTK